MGGLFQTPCQSISILGDNGMGEFQNAIHTVAMTSGTNSTYHSLSGQACKLLLCSTSTSNAIYFDLNSTAVTSTSAQYMPGDYPVIINCDGPDYIAVLGQTSGYLHITEFI